MTEPVSRDGASRPQFPTWSDVPRPCPYERLTIWSAIGGLDFRFGLVASAIGALTHWTGLRTVPCVGMANSCDWCAKQQPRLKWYIGGVSMQDCGAKRWRRGRCLVELTDSARVDCPAIAAPIDSIRGRTLYLSRLGPRSTGRVTAHISQEICVEANRTRPIDVRKTLVGIWGHGPGAIQQVFCHAMLSEIATVVSPEEGRQ